MISSLIGTGAGGGPLIARLAEMGYSVVGFDAGAYFRPLENFASDEASQSQLFWTDERLVDGANPLKMGSNNSGKAVGGSTLHYAMVSLRFRPEWFRSRSLLGYGADWPLDWRDMWRYYARAERDLAIAGPVRYPWAPDARVIPIARTRSTARPACWHAARKLWAIAGQRRRWPPSPHPVGIRRPASIAAFVVLAVRRMPSRASLSPIFPARWRPVRKSATSPWSAGSRRMRPGTRRAYIIIAAGHGIFSAPGR